MCLAFADLETGLTSVKWEGLVKFPSPKESSVIFLVVRNDIVKFFGIFFMFLTGLLRSNLV